MQDRKAKLNIKKKSNLHHTRGVTPKRETSGRAHLHDSGPEQHRNVAAEASRW